jgi:hypothetical protein
MPKTYKTIEAKTYLNNKIITKRFQAEFPQNRQKGKNITKPTESKPFTGFSKLQNQSASKRKILKPHFYKTITFSIYQIIPEMGGEVSLS